ncbi:DEAD/DEAH box helicase family protein [Lactiplantibacillus plantarum]|uniref:DEAD/DEAH box helicase family protein n=1 Tax=Lactiplantibacillus plantarum TaxID=1590 RepID=UPI0018AD4B01|nr:DEAD/DEAH box helicase family protein [Lactiplantibacillus plantarum]MBS0939842.1 DEAD/DEAH box helicase family protein [Lactiplantibacillus plantarum]WGF85472.1 DEAD/DEAH box helicase family protein [Lactiplantibacillus plantarum]WGG42797.1 DEAD/DEAH box helicase family protein [Lactiplantibacillus plantarum]
MTKSKNKDVQSLKFPLVEQAEHAEKDLFQENWAIPDYITNNLAHTLRPYQDKALSNYRYTQTQINPNPQHVLFNMATGSGKTDLMAALILYLYQDQGYTNFLFTVNTKSVLMKTKDNLLNTDSDKYLFQDKIEIDGQYITIQEVNRYPRIKQANTIYLKLATVQTVSNDLFTVKENTMGLTDYEQDPVAILADEAHHYSASTKSEKEAEHTWESAINKILNARNTEDQKNLLLEFTATVDFEKETIYDKYRDKVVYRYPLSRFMYDGYSKQVKRIETSASDEEKMLNVVLLSQFRKYRAQIENVTSTFKPIIMFKSAKVAVSKKANAKFNEIIAKLTAKDLLTFIERQQLMDSNDNAALEIAYNYYVKNKDDLGKIVREIKHDFDPKNILNANDASGNMLEKGQYEALNTLESPNNFYRVVFAVAKLTEGWDVLNLYDIVRISEEAKANKNSTMVEAQLIGRGARYYPFEINGEKSYQRRFDQDPSNKQLLLETLHYHTMNEPQYLKQLVGSLKQMDLPTGKDSKNSPIEIKVKSEFKRTEAYRHGKIYYNESVDVPSSYFDSIQKYGIEHKSDLQRNLNYGSREVNYSAYAANIETKTISVSKFDDRYIKKAIQKLDFYQFSNLKKYIPNLQSMNDFIYGSNWLNANHLKLFLTVPVEYREANLTAEEILKVIIDLLKEYQVKIQSGYVKQRGTNNFIGYPIKEYLSDYNKRVPEYDTQTQFDKTQDIKVYQMKDDPFYVYDNAIVNRLEYQLIERIKAYVEDLKVKYGKAVYLFRMDETMHRESAKSEKLKLHQYQEKPKYGVHLTGFQPDFILFLEDTNDYYFQIFIEPKGMSGERFEKELWKEELLLYMTDHHADMEFMDNESNIQISGLKFYTNGDGRGTMAQLKGMTNIVDYTDQKKQLVDMIAENDDTNFSM